jgi:DNA-binding IclR family transcriptional regulator
MQKESLKPIRKAASILRALKGRSLTGLRNKDLAAAAGLSPPEVTRVCAVLIEEGFVTQSETGAYSLSVSLLQIAAAHASEVGSAMSRIQELDQRVRAGSTV